MTAGWIVYAAATVLGELLLPLAPAATALLDAAVLVVALTHFGWAQRSPIAVGDPTIRVLPAVALVPLMRLLSLTLPVPDMAPIFWIAFATGPLLLAVVASARLAHMDVDQLLLARLPADALSLLVVAASLPAGIAVGILAPVRFDLATDSPLGLAFMAGFLVVGAAIPEELVFRGLLQTLIADLVGGAAPVVVSAVFASTYVGTQSPLVVVVMGGIGLAYGLEVRRSGSLWPALAGHAVLLLASVFLAPLLRA